MPASTSFNNASLQIVRGKLEWKENTRKKAEISQPVDLSVEYSNTSGFEKMEVFETKLIELINIKPF